jgi:hypothetical protein
MPNPALDVRNWPSSVALVPEPIEWLGGDSELYDEIAREVLRLDLATLFAPQSD